MPDSLEFVLSYQNFLQLFDLRTHHFDYSAAFGTDQMVVVLMFVFMLKVSDTAPEISLSRQPSITDHPHRPIYGGKADLGVFFSDQIVKVINRGVFLRLEEYIQNLLSLFTIEHTVASKVLSEYGFC